MDKITGIGNALVDSLVHITDDAELERLKLPKGSMQLIDEQQYAALSREMNRLSPKCATGGWHGWDGSPDLSARRATTRWGASTPAR